MDLPETEKLFYKEPYEHIFTARVIHTIEENSEFRVVLDRTLFYPESGGQPCDTGTINGLQVVNVTEKDGIIFHTVQGRLKQGEAVHGNVDWDQRFDHMQQHTGQHILSAAFARIYNAKTIGFHLGREYVTIDIDKSITDREKLSEVETLASSVVFNNKKVNILEKSREQAVSLPLRKPPAVDDEILRIVEIEDFDMIACCGTHVRTTGEVGVVKILKAEKYKSGTRIYFLSGSRALRYFNHVAGIVQDISNNLNTGYNDLVTKVLSLEQNNKAFKRRLRQTEESLLRFIENDIVSQLSVDGKKQVFEIFNENISISSLRKSVQNLVAKGNIVIVSGTSDQDSSGVLIGKSDNVDVDIKKHFNHLMEKIKGRGGGPENMMQGTGHGVTDLGKLLHQTAEAIKNAIA